MAWLDPAISYPHQIANDAMPVSNHPMEMTGSSPVMTELVARAMTELVARSMTALVARAMTTLTAKERSTPAA
jgi:hypothetical protein